ncbi:MAG TPA: isoprenylcysteine carboxylmethyltransferase family protein [Tepidisphaeraceae bacterium]|nr:isoprenylcysteine carboxylmethyltransferase family protein [Tepidisphaeraceae bacterium]
MSLAALIFAVGYVALAAWGWGGWKPMLASPARAGVCLALAALATATPLCGCNTRGVARGRGGNDWILPILLLAGIAMGAASAWCDRRNFWTIDGDVARWGGLAIFLAGAILRVAAMRTLGSRFSVWVMLQENHRLHTTGCYRIIRHPSYTGVLLTLVGWALTFRSIVGVLIAVAMVALLTTRMEAEEVLLISEFGDDYHTYRRRTWRLAPYVY